MSRLLGTAKYAFLVLSRPHELCAAMSGFWEKHLLLAALLHRDYRGRLDGPWTASF